MSYINLEIKQKMIMTNGYIIKGFGYLLQYFKQLLLMSCLRVLNKSIYRSGLNYQRTFKPIFFVLKF